jgi:hypothetical protein
MTLINLNGQFYLNVMYSEFQKSCNPKLNVMFIIHITLLLQIEFITNSVAHEPEGSSPHSQLATGPYPDPVESNPHPNPISLKPF